MLFLAAEQPGSKTGRILPQCLSTLQFFRDFFHEWRRDPPNLLLRLMFQSIAPGGGFLILVLSVATRSTEATEATEGNEAMMDT
ncbi:MAG: hypothetical protein KJ052_00295 [Candidatus Hydrogenedentes bacterium]|nr:hypothetical protein [Candidatus Hydrogenedentota bacterium]